MADRTVRVRLEAAVDGLTAGFAKAEHSVTSFADKAEAQLSKNRQSIDRLGSTAGLLGAAIGVGVGLAVKSYAEFDKQMSSVASTGADAKTNLDALRESAVNAGADTAYSATEAAQGIESLLKAGVEAKDVMGGGLTGALNLAAAGSLDVGAAAEIAATAMTQFKLQGKDVPHIADLLAAGAGKAQGEVSDLAAALKQSGLVAAQYGLTLEDTTGTLAAFASQGLLGSDAGTAFKTMLQSLTPNSAAAAEAMKDIGLQAYDAKGNFIGITAVAEQLRNGLSTLSDEQQNAALKIIFGADAVRAANALYLEGGAGIQEWIDKTNDAGYAAQVAAEKQNNLAGDIEFLGGTLDSVFLKSGSGANEVLRGLVQGADDLLGKIGDLPPGLLQMGLGIAAVGSGGLLAFAGVTKLATGAVELKAALAAIAPEGTKAAGALNAVGRAGLAAAGGLLAGAAFGAWIDSSREAEPVITDATAALLRLAKAGPDAASGLNEFFQLGDGFTNDIVVEEVDGMGDAIRRLVEKTKGETLNDLFSGWLPGSNQAEILTDRVGKLDQAISGMARNGATEQAGKAFLQLSQEAAKAGVGYDQLIALFPQYKASLVDQANQLGITTLNARDYAAWMQGQVPAAVQAAAAANPELAKTLGDVGGAATEATESMHDLVSAYFEVGQAALAASNSEIGYEQAVDGATASLKEYRKGLIEKYEKQGKSKEAAEAAAAADIKAGKALDIGTEAGRKNKSALDQIAGATQRLVQDQAANNASTKTLAATTQQGRDQFIAAAKQMGLNGKEANRLADKYGLIPKDVKTKTSAPGATEAAKQAADMKRKIDALPASKRAVIQTILDRSGVDAAKAALASVTSKTVVITTVSRGSRNSTGQAVASANAYGGPIRGYSPHSRADNLLSWVTAGEFVQDVPSVRRYGEEFHQALLAGLIDPAAARALIPGHAYGGLVGAADGLPQYATGGTVVSGQLIDVSALARAVASIVGPLSAIASAQRSMATELSQLRTAQKADNKPTAAYNAAVRRETAAKSTVATLAGRERKEADDTRKAYDRLTAAKQRSKGTSATVRAAQRDYETQRSQERAAEARLAKARLSLNAATTARQKVEDAYKTAVAKTKDAMSQYTDAQKEFQQAQQAIADASRQQAEGFAGNYRSGGQSLEGWLRSIDKGSTALATLNTQVSQLRKLGLNEALIQDLLNRDPAQASRLAGQLISKGKTAVSAFNQANANLTAASNVLGLSTATNVSQRTPVLNRKVVTGYLGSSSADVAAALAKATIVVSATVTNPFTGEQVKAMATNAAVTVADTRSDRAAGAANLGTP